LDRAIECTKTTLGLKLFLSLAWEGERGLGEYVASRYSLARRFHEALSRQPGISCPYVPESNIVCFRVDNADQLAIPDRLLADGRANVGTDTLNGERFLRLVLMAPDTDDGTVDELIEAVLTV